jgi:archaellum component FlaF (FlaF/FlaG flagellin family)
MIIGRFRSRRGISAVVGAILLAGTTVLGITLVAWASSNVSTTEFMLASSSSSKSNKLSENLSIENVWFKQNPQPAVNITLTNVGNIGLNVTQVKINDTRTIWPTNIAILSGQAYFYQHNYPWKSGLPINITLTTARGSIFTTQARPP